jgi:hypothetical protein
MATTQISTAEALLTRAIGERRVVTARYPASGNAAVRVFFPHVLYRSAAGELLVDVFQVDGPSGRGHLPDWRVLKVAGLREVDVLDTVFIPMPRPDIVADGYRRQILAECVGPRG